MIIIGLKTRENYSMIVFEQLCGIEYDQQTGELLFLRPDAVRVAYLDKGTPANEVWDHVRKAMGTLFEPRSMIVPTYYVNLDLTQFQKGTPRF
jgi:hypothetical protein